MVFVGVDLEVNVQESILMDQLNKVTDELSKKTSKECLFYSSLLIYDRGWYVALGPCPVLHFYVPFSGSVEEFICLGSVSVVIQHQCC